MNVRLITTSGYVFRKIPVIFLFAAYFLVLLSILPVNAQQEQPQPPPFSWDNATVYFLMTDRFLNGDRQNDLSYGRETDIHGNPVEGYETKKGRFQGGDLKGITMKLNEGYFSRLGVNALWITSPLEQIRGWYGGNGYRHFGYHGYYHLDFTEIDRNMGTEDELRELIDTAHSKGIRIIFDVVMNHAGYADFQSMYEFDFGDPKLGWMDYYYGPTADKDISGSSYRAQMNLTSASRWANWWGPDWLRANLPGYNPCVENNDLTGCLAGLPDFRTESKAVVGIPPFLSMKWGPDRLAREQAELQAFFQRTGKPATVRNHLIKWLTDWVREYGVDGFRIDTAKHVEMDAWNDLKQEAVLALREWKQKNPHKKLDNLDFWMTGEVWGHGVNKSDYFTKGGFDSVINFTFNSVPKNMATLDATYSSYAGNINSDPAFNVLSYVSSHDTSLYDRGDLINAGTALLLAPGGVQIYYGDETARPLEAPPSPLRTMMNWSSINPNLLEHWQKLGQFRNRHLAVGGGTHQKLADSPYVFSRVYSKNEISDRVVVAIGAKGTVNIPVGTVFANQTVVRDFYTGQTATVNNGGVTVSAHANGVVLLEVVSPQIPSGGTGIAPSPALGVPGMPVLLDREQGRLLFSWTGVQDKRITSYRVYRDGTRVGTTSINYFEDRGLAADTDFTYRVTAVDANGFESAPGQATTFSTKSTELTDEFDEVPPSIPSGLTATEITANSAKLRWNAAEDNVGVVQYELYDGTVLIGQTNQLEFTLNNLVAGKVYSISVRALDAEWNVSAFSESHVFNAKDSVAPTAPAGLLTSAVSSSGFRVTWTPSTDNIKVAGYSVFLNNSEIAQTALPEYTFSQLLPATTYTVRVVAFDGDSNRSISSPALTVVTEQPAPPPDRTPPTVPDGLRLEQLSTNELTVSWNASQDDVEMAGYLIVLNGKQVASSLSTTHRFTGLLPSTRYIIRIVARDVANNRSAMSPAFFVTTSAPPDLTPPSVPTGLRVDRVTDRQLTISWNASTDNVGVSGYSLYLNGELVDGSLMSTHTFSNLKPATVYEVRIAAFDAQKNTSVLSVPVKSTTLVPPDTQPPSVPGGLVAGRVSSKGFTVTWSPARDNRLIKHYVVNVDGRNIAVSEQTSYTLFGLLPNTRYTVRIFAVDSANNRSGLSQPLAVTTSPIVRPDTTAPSVPTGLKPVSIGNVNLSVTWNAALDNVRVTGYQVYLNDRLVAVSTVPRYSFSGLRPSTRYSVRVVAVDAANNRSKSSAPLSVTTGSSANGGGRR